MKEPTNVSAAFAEGKKPRSQQGRSPDDSLTHTHIHTPTLRLNEFRFDFIETSGQSHFILLMDFSNGILTLSGIRVNE